ncbi:MAG: alkaline phosphatase family protein [Acidobacteriota bacterium]
MTVGAVVAAMTALAPLSAAAYVGPGAGFAFLSSFLVLLIVFFSSLFSLLSWPFRVLFRAFRRRKVYTRAKIKRLVILGLDGLDPELAAKFMQQGKLPHLARLREEGTFLPLQTTYPPISPVAWSSFQTGVNPGQHNIYDFLTRDRGTYLPRLSSAEIRPASRNLRIGKYVLPLGRPQTKLLRKSKPFWVYLGEAGIFSAVLRVPITFPPERFSGVLLSGMCVPDLRGSQGTFAYYTTHPNELNSRRAGLQPPLRQEGEGFSSYLTGPDCPSAREGASELQAPFRIRPVPERQEAYLQVTGQQVILRKGEYSDWIQVPFHAGLGLKLYGICRFLLKEVHPHLELYVTPINIDPGKPALPISHPLSYSIYLSKLLGPYATLGLAEDTWALNEDILDEKSYLKQCYLIHEERERMFFDALEKTPRGVCVCVFDTPDRIQHMFWRYLEPEHPAHNGGDVTEHAGVIEELYRRMDDLVGRTRAQLDGNTVLLVLSDHGFKSFQRGVNLNSWLHQNGYLALKDGATESGEWFKNVDWSRTKAYALGLNGIYINQKNRERHGVVNPGKETAVLKKALREKLQGLPDPKKGQPAITEVFDRREIYTGPYVENAPDLIVGYHPGYRTSWESVTGKVTPEVFTDNKRAWSGDHCMDPRKVPGVLFCNRRIEGPDPALVDVAPTVLDLFGVRIPSHMNGKPWRLGEPGRKQT